jgi:hypothetical protein
MLEYVIFSIDNVDDLHTQARFFRWVDTLRAMEKLTGTLHSCIGSYEGDLERSFMMLAIDFDKYIVNSEYVKDQECFLRVPGDQRQPCVLEDKHGNRLSIPPMVPLNEQPESLNYTYFNKKYWTTDAT